MPEHNPYLPEWRITEIAEQTAQKVVDLLCQRRGSEDLHRPRHNLECLGNQAEQAQSRRNEGRRTIYTVIGGGVMLIAGYIGAALNLKGYL